MPFCWHVIVDNFSLAKIDKESGKHLAAQTRHAYQNMINGLEACNRNTLAANKQCQDQRKHFEISRS